MKPGTECYAEHAEELVERFEAILFSEKHKAVLHVLPSAPSAVLDVGAGTSLGLGLMLHGLHRGAIGWWQSEPTDSMRLAGIRLHKEHPIEWINDSLPDLACMCARGQKFEVVMLTAVVDASRRAGAAAGNATGCIPDAIPHAGRHCNHDDKSTHGAGRGNSARCVGGNARAEQAADHRGAEFALDTEPFQANFRQGLRELGYEEGRNLRLEWRAAAGNPELATQQAAALVRLGRIGDRRRFTPAALAVKKATSTTPIVMALPAIQWLRTLWQVWRIREAT